MANEIESPLADEASSSETSGLQGTQEPSLSLPTKPPAFIDLEKEKNVKPASAPGNMELLLDVPLSVAVHLGSTKMLIKDLLRLGQGSVVELDKIAGDPMDIMIGDKLIARGEIVVVNEMFGVRITDIISPVERLATLK